MGSQTDLFTIMKERQAVKRFDTSYTINEEEIKELLALATRAPSSWNLQHWKFLVINEETSKNELLPIAYSQKQVREASAVVVVLGDLQANQNAEVVFAPDVQAGKLSKDVKESIIRQIELVYADVPTAPRDAAFSNASLAAMQLMLAAKAKGLDSCPMGGFNTNQLVDTFEIPSRYVPVMLVALGKAAKAARPSSRLEIEQTIVWNRF